MESRTPVPLLGLPLEIWISIFEHTVLSTESNSRILTTIRLSGVSKTWRNIVLGMPELWASFRWSSRRPGMELCTQRAGTKPLSISLRVIGIDGKLTCLPIAAQEVHRLKAFYLAYEEDYIDDRHWPGNWTIPAPQLEILSIHNLYIPKGLFNGQMPLLQSLTLESASFDWVNFYHLLQLLHLSIRRPRWGPTSIRTFLDLLKGCPNLKSLHASGAFYRGDDEHSVHLQDLESLVIDHDHYYHAIQFLRYLTFPHTARVHVRLNLLVSAPHEPAGILEALERCWVGSTRKTQKIILAAERRFEFKLFEHDRDNPETPTIDISSGINSSNSVISLPTQLFEYVNLSELECFDFDGEGTQPPCLWTEFDQLPKLRTLKVRNSFARSFLEFVQNEAKNGEHKSVPPFPHLQELAIVYEKSHQFRLGAGVEEFNSYLHQLCEYLQSRCSIGFGVTSLTVLGPHRMTRETENALSECVQELKHMIKQHPWF
ncbi:hypothetical protein BDN72DRAFT_963109 [Pluteus cervinus]|uniref:Uncharacterized protein n=1 Tax=Pluteus cervinus TaxID=181527 RepID=A0ACD3AH15_9AGAR|nr:hypothetical protein BDN72DRAFT_963109 [Pluteus cervinus]